MLLTLNACRKQKKNIIKVYAATADKDEEDIEIL